MQPSDTTELRERDGPPAAVALANLAALDRARLRRLWQALWGRPAPAKASCLLLRYGLAWRIQERAYGGLSAASRRRLRTIAQQLDVGAGQHVPFAPGTRLIRQWRAQRHEVTVLDSGYAYRGARYASLSAIARLIPAPTARGRASLD